ncbi:Uncharacterised protein [Legionella steigerwaltii]|uniref:Uncharacterized protein n=1 Tax=Legionella steigerwaltii TaxID=460 RepID=A0A378L913_9GAMM|nr:hypothetical protein [Legionella steigerwaltii]KTD80256.1 hypothetical protein Lstg_0518 [Legionella steigerwaltii]STY22338.1 Uncharacterised protein [Legionella steigerwaltii]
MINKISTAVIAYVILLASIPSFANASHIKINFKKTYCGNQEYLGNHAAKRPHLHCGETFISYKKATGDHINIAEPGTCSRTNLVFDDIKSKKDAFEDYDSIYNALVSYHQSGCPNQLASE